MQPNDICGRFGGTIFCMLLERGTMNDVEAWAEKTARHAVRIVVSAALMLANQVSPPLDGSSSE